MMNGSQRDAKVNVMLSRAPNRTGRQRGLTVELSLRPQMRSTPHLVFDLDGTISDPAVGIGRSINYALDHFGYQTLPESEIPKLIGPPLDVSFASITGSTSTDHIGSLVAKYRERYADVGFAENVLYPGITAALDALVAARIPLGLCTSKRVDFADSILCLFGLRDHFHFLNGGDIGIHKHQQLASLLCNGMISTAATMIGDRAVDIAAAKANGLASVGVLWGHGSLAELSAAGAATLLESPVELEWFANMA